MSVRRAALAIAALAGAAAASGPSTHPAWLVGTWDVQGPAVLPVTQPCRSGTDQIAFSRRGYWVGIAVGDYGRWRIAGRTLVEVELRPGDGREPAELRTWSATVERIAPGQIGLRHGRARLRMVRCRRDADGAFAPTMPH